MGNLYWILLVETTHPILNILAKATVLLFSFVCVGLVIIQFLERWMKSAIALAQGWGLKDTHK